MGLNNRYEFVLLFDVKDGNPNGDPDAGNLPRMDAETGMGLVTDVCLKRKVRNFVQMTQTDNANRKIFVREKAILNNMIDESHEQEGVKDKEKGDKTEAAKNWMCKNYYDVRTFGAVMSTGKNAGQVRGPIQMTFSRSIDPVVASEHTITRMAVTTSKEAEAQSGENRTMGRKFTVPYGLYRCHGFISAHLAKQTGFDEDDLELFWQSLMQMFDHDRSASRGEMSARGLYVFKHSNALGHAPATVLLDRVQVQRKEECDIARNFNDYQVEIDDSNLPEGIELIKLLG
ncbi:type I-C CRISPR-associated protein Cas7/Csd2 [sulfur-oxidizing endosymbiont of Gigantopelta aegis]|uniref:type I-C CRISPR-associated protein Cas7/Csd2 n=1 Tax=sulfur-oxidizing endosymbiont of Gigantopelta aegis TaxID=2794934 RepID=UPI0018DECCEA|nr:type I-C CRISPR-associated protein Cas7/Csd2 [sulfur-oxidizing endosymbiont of Gigantopelta aegis]